MKMKATVKLFSFLTRLSHLLSLCFQPKPNLRQLYKILISLITNLATATLRLVPANLLWRKKGRWGPVTSVPSKPQGDNKLALRNKYHTPSDKDNSRFVS